MAPIEIWQLTLTLAILNIYKGAAQTFLGDTQTPGIFYAPLPEPGDDTNILDMPFTLIPVSSSRYFTDLDYDPENEMVYWCSFGENQISRIRLDGNNEEAIISTNSPQQMDLDLVNGKIYWTSYNSASISRANLDGSSVEVISETERTAQPFSILVSGIDGYVLWSTRGVNQIVKASLDGSNTKIVKDIFARGMVTEQCADNTTLLYYYTNGNTLAVKNLKTGEDTTIKVFSFSDRANGLSRYGTKMVWAKGYGSVIYQFELRTSEVIVHNGTVRLTDGTTRTVSSIITIVSNATYDEPVAVQNCPDDIIVTLDGDTNSITASVSWSEPVLKGWSGCHTMEFRGNGTNGGNFTLGITNLSYVASDTAGNTDECRFSVTVRSSSGAAQTFLGDDRTPGIFYAPLPEPGDDTNILDMPFTLIPVSSGSYFTDLDYDPENEMVYWCSFIENKISRIRLDGSNQSVIIWTNAPISMDLDLVNGKVYWTLLNDDSISRANLDGSSVEVFYQYTRMAQPRSIVVTASGYVLWSRQTGAQIVKAYLDSNSTEIVKDIFAAGMVSELCADNSTRLYYYANRNTLGVMNVESSEDKTIDVLSVSNAVYGLDKYGSKLFWAKGFTHSRICQYDLRTSEVSVHNGTVRLTNGTTRTVSPKIRIVSSATYDEPVAIRDCPDDIIVTLDDGANSTTVSVSWNEPVLNSWSSCPEMEFRGNGTNGGNFTLGTTDLSYVASDTAGNTDECRFSVTVRLNSSADVTMVTTTDPGTCSATTDPGTGSATTDSLALWTLCIAFLFLSLLVF